MNPTGRMAPPELDGLLPGRAVKLHELLNYGYRAAWQATVGGDTFAVKSDVRPGYQEREIEAHLHAARHGIPVPEVVSFGLAPAPTMVVRWVEGVALQGRATAAEWRAAGVLLRRVHEAPVLHPRNESWANSVQSRLEADLQHVVAQSGLAHRDANALVELAGELGPTVDAAPLLWLHGDCQANHFLMDPAGGQVSAVVDWADAEEGDAIMDFAVLTLFDEGKLGPLLDGYEALAEFRQRLSATLPLYRAIRATGAARWLSDHGYTDSWTIDAIRRAVTSAAG